MESLELCSRLGLREEEKNKLVTCRVGEKEYKSMRRLYEQSHGDFFRAVLKAQDPEGTFLMYYCRFACETWERYMQKGIPEQVFTDTFMDIRYWCDNCYREYRRYGIRQYDWFWRLFDLKLFRLGRLEYELMDAEETIVSGNFYLEKGEPVINVHIPQGSPLCPETCRESLRIALRWFGREKKYVCHSWLLFPGLKELLPKGSNILSFQKLFRVAAVDYREREAEWRIFGRVQAKAAEYPEATSLQRNAKKYLLQGKRLGNGFGCLVPEEQNAVF